MCGLGWVFCVGGLFGFLLLLVLFLGVFLAVAGFLLVLIRPREHLPNSFS